MFERIIVICTGNICRSPLGEAVLRSRLQGRRHEVISAGIGAMTGHAADPMAQELATENGLDISAHRAQQATPIILQSMDLILTMDDTHSDWINRRFPQLRGRVHKMLKWREGRDIDDPYRRPRAAFEKAFEDIQLGADDWIRRLG